MPVLQVHNQFRIAQHAGVTSFQPVIPPAHSLIAPLDLGTRNRIVGKGVVPRADDCPHGSFHVLQHLRYAVAIAVEQAADQETWDLDFVLRTHWAAPESSVMLM